MNNCCNNACEQGRLCPNRKPVDVQSIWRKFGWLPLAERLQDKSEIQRHVRKTLKLVEPRP